MTSCLCRLLRMGWSYVIHIIHATPYTIFHATAEENVLSYVKMRERYLIFTHERAGRFAQAVRVFAAINAQQNTIKALKDAHPEA